MHHQLKVFEKKSRVLWLMRINYYCLGDARFHKLHNTNFYLYIGKTYKATDGKLSIRFVINPINSKKKW